MSTTTTNNVAKIAALVAGLGLVAMTFVAAAPAKAADSMMFNVNLTVGSKGADVTALQNWLVAKGYSIPAGATGYFGGQTKAALAAYQATNKISPAVGYFGPLTRAAVNAGGSMSGGTSTVPGCAPGAAFSSTTGAACTSGSSTGGITTIGVEGSINVEKESAGLKTTVYEGDIKDSLLGVRIEAKDSDVNFSRVRVDLGTTTDAYTRQFSKVYLLDDTGAVLASKDLNSSNVTRVSGTPVHYYVTLAGFNSLIKKNVKRSYWVAFDAYPSISTAYQGTKTINFYGADAIRVTDGAGLDQYSNIGTGTVGTETNIAGAGIQATFNFSSNLSDTAILTVSTDPAVRKAATIVANQGANNNEKDKEEIGSFRLLAEKDDVLLRDLNVTVANNATSTVGIQTVYLYDGSTAVGTASADSNGIYHFTSVNQTLTRDAYKTYTIKADFRSVSAGTNTIKVGAVSVVSAESKGTGKTLTNSTLSAGAGETMTVVSNGATITLATPSINIVTTKNTSGTTTEAHLSSVFNLTITAIGSDAVFGLPASAFTFALLKNGVATGTPTSGGVVTVYYPATQPTGTTGYTASGFTVPRNATVTIPVTYKRDANTSAAVDGDLGNGDYAVRLNTVTYTANAATVNNDYSNNSAYVTSTFTRP
jgi:Putative peptidoglycan binding domain